MQITKIQRSRGHLVSLLNDAKSLLSWFLYGGGGEDPISARLNS